MSRDGLTSSGDSTFLPSSMHSNRALDPHCLTQIRASCPTCSIPFGFSPAWPLVTQWLTCRQSRKTPTGMTMPYSWWQAVVQELAQTHYRLFDAQLAQATIRKQSLYRG